MAEIGWDEVDGVEPIARERQMDRLELLAEVTHEVRGRLLRQLASPQTVAELATTLDVPVTRLYHHTNRLEQLGLIEVVATRQVGGVVERRYRAVAESFKIDPQLLDEADESQLSRALGALFDVAKVELQTEVESGAWRSSAMEEELFLTLADLHLTSDRLQDLRQRLTDLLDDFRQDSPTDPETNPVQLFIASFPKRAGAGPDRDPTTSGPPGAPPVDE